MEPVPVTEEERGVDVGQIRALLHMSVVGGFAAVVHGSPLPTRDLDVVPSRERDNLDRLGRALQRLHALIPTDGEPVPAPLDGPFLANMPVMLRDQLQRGDAAVG